MFQETSRATTLVLGGFALVCALIADFQRRSMGFPDGHLTDLDRAERVLLMVFAGGSVLVSFGFGFVGLRPSSDRMLTRGLIIAYAVFVLVLLLVDQYLRQRLDDGIGG